VPDVRLPSDPSGHEWTRPDVVDSSHVPGLGASRFVSLVGAPRSTAGTAGRTATGDPLPGRGRVSLTHEAVRHDLWAYPVIGPWLCTDRRCRPAVTWTPSAPAMLRTDPAKCQLLVTDIASEVLHLPSPATQRLTSRRTLRKHEEATAMAATSCALGARLPHPTPRLGIVPDASPSGESDPGRDDNSQR